MGTDSEASSVRPELVEGWTEGFSTASYALRSTFLMIVSAFALAEFRLEHERASADVTVPWLQPGKNL